jgi:Tol biopolymer transport system component
VGVVASSSSGEWWPDAYNWHFDWSPDLAELAYSSSDRSALLARDVTTGGVRTLTTGNLPFGAKWSPAGDLIVFCTGFGNIETVKPDGTGRKEVIRAGANYYYLHPDISITGSHILYRRYGSSEGNDLFRATISGKSAANLTSGIAGYESSAGWR